MRKVALVVPCYQEAGRFDPEAFSGLTLTGDVTLVLVDDGSTDDTAACLRRFADRTEGAAELVSLPRNLGKAEAVRTGLLHGLAGGAEVVGYLDADGATPAEELPRLLEQLEAEAAAAVLGSRIQYLGVRIERSAARHYVGRLFASLASLILRAPVYDTQCGAKVFRRSPALEAALEEPFRTRWCFDIELLGRLLIGNETTPGLPLSQIRELPLRRWRDVPGSKIAWWSAPRVVWELWTVARDLDRRRR